LKHCFTVTWLQTASLRSLSIFHHHFILLLFLIYLSFVLSVNNWLSLPVAIRLHRCSYWPVSPHYLFATSRLIVCSIYLHPLQADTPAGLVHFIECIVELYASFSMYISSLVLLSLCRSLVNFIVFLLNLWSVYAMFTILCWQVVTRRQWNVSVYDCRSTNVDQITPTLLAIIGQSRAGVGDILAKSENGYFWPTSRFCGGQTPR